MTTRREAARLTSEYDECDHGVPGGNACIECVNLRHRDEVQALDEENEALTAAIKSAICMLVEGPDVIGGRASRESAIKILRKAIRPESE